MTLLASYHIMGLPPQCSAPVCNTCASCHDAHATARDFLKNTRTIRRGQQILLRTWCNPGLEQVMKLWTLF